MVSWKNCIIVPLTLETIDHTYAELKHIQLPDGLERVKQSVKQADPGKFSPYHQTPSISHTLVGNKLVDHSDVVGAALVSAAQKNAKML